ncbi:MAG: CbiX/SirB N-terminal domain-containing protein [Nitrososphaerota archaeon]
MLDGDWLVIVVGHGQPPRDMPRDILSEYLSLLHRHGRTKLEDERLAELTRVVMDWPRNSENDPYWSSLQTLASMLRQALGCEVVAAFNEFCPPAFDEVLEDACKSGREKIMVLTTMLIPGGIHSEVEIPEMIREMSSKYRKEIVYIWPIDLKNLLDFFVKNIYEHLRHG